MPDRSDGKGKSIMTYSDDEKKRKEELIREILEKDRVGHLTRRFLEKRPLSALENFATYVGVFKRKG